MPNLESLLAGSGNFCTFTLGYQGLQQTYIIEALPGGGGGWGPCRPSEFWNILCRCLLMLVAYCQLFRHFLNLVEGGCLLSRFYFKHCRYFLGHVACQNLSWQGLIIVRRRALGLQTTFLREQPWIIVMNIFVPKLRGTGVTYFVKKWHFSTLICSSTCGTLLDLNNMPH